MNLELKLRINEVCEGVEVNLNNFLYNVYYAEVASYKKFKVLIPVFTDLSLGDCITTDRWKLMYYKIDGTNDEFCLRIDKMEIVDSAGFKVSEYLNTKIVGMFLKSDKTSIRSIGPEQKPFYIATLKVRDACSDTYEVPLIAFGKQALRLSTVKKASVIEAKVTIKERKNDDGYEFAIVDFEVKKEIA